MVKESGGTFSLLTLHRLYKKLPDLLAFQGQIKKKYKQQIPSFPLRKESEIDKQNLPFLNEFLDIFIKKAVNVAFYDEQFQHFFSFFPHKFGSGIIHAEIQLRKHSGGRYTQATCAKKIQYAFCCCRNWKTRWFTVTDQGVFYTLKKREYEIKEMLNFSHTFKIYYGLDHTGNDLGIEIKSSYRLLQLKAHNLKDFVIFVTALKLSFSLSPHKQIHRFKSFSSPKSHCSTEYFIDGQNYFAKMKESILQAQKYIFITDWMMTPYFQLQRGKQLSDRSSRFDYILEAAAIRGVKIYIILYMEPKIALNNDSEFVEHYFQKMHQNIKVVRHPNYILIPFLWSHHEKMVIIDQKTAFMGGLDICYGRWDTQQHNLVDCSDPDKQLWKGADFCNFRISDIYSPRNFLVSNINKKNQPRMPWHDICVKIQGESVHDLARHFIQYWNFVNFQTKFDERQLLLHSGTHSIPKSTSKEPQTSTRRSFYKFFDNIKDAIKPNTGQAVYQSKAEQKYVEQDLIKETYRSIGEDSNASTVGQDGLQRAQKVMQQGERQYYNHYLKEKSMLDNIDLPNIDDFKNYSKKLGHKLKDIFVEKKFLQIKNSTDARLMVAHQQQLNALKKSTFKIIYLCLEGNYKHQILRSASTWSLGLEDKTPQSSIHQAYLDLIKNSKYYIYIQNQFFISKQNGVCAALIQRINRAFINKQTFKVLIFMPLLPGFQGDVCNENSSSVMRVQLYWEYRTLNRAKSSLYSSLSHIPNIDDYLKVCSLRRHGLTQDGIPITQILYIHSKLMIVDDETVILGSANINDRSLLGDRDSEIAICIQCQDQQLDEQGRRYSKSAKALRMNLYKQHFDFKDEACWNFHNQVTWKQIRINAKNNTEIYRTIFGCYPDDQMKVVADVQKMMILKPEKQVYLEEIKHIKGHAVEFPLKFLEKENLNLKINQREYFIPFINFT